MDVWITRTDSLAGDSALAIKAAGFTPIIAPLLTLAAVSIPAAAPGPDSRLAFTSRNGVSAFARLTDRRDWRVYAVGEATAKAAREAGFIKVKSASGDVKALANLLIEDGPDDIVHYSGVHIAGDLVGDLIARGAAARREIIYETRAVDALPNLAMAALGTSSRPLVICLYSPKAANILIRLLPEAASARPLITLSLSANIDAALGSQGDELNFAKRIITHSPDEVAMLEALETIATSA